MGTVKENQQGLVNHLGARQREPEVAIGVVTRSQKRPRAVREGHWSRPVAPDNLFAEYVYLGDRGNKYLDLTFLSLSRPPVGFSHCPNST